MTVYNFNLGIGWASSGVEYAQAYRAKIFRENNIPAKFIFTDLIRHENIAHFTQNIGMKNDEVLWLYSFFTDIETSESTYTLEALLSSIALEVESIEHGSNLLCYHFKHSPVTMVVATVKDSPQLVQRVEFLVNQVLIRKDYYTSKRLFSEYYYQQENLSVLHKRVFFNQDDSIAYEEINDNGVSTYRFPDRILYSKEELIKYMLEQLELSSDDLLILDRSTGIGQSIFQYKGDAKLAVVIHAEHFSPNSETEQTILWNNYYDYQFTNANLVDCFIASTQAQADLLTQQFSKYTKHQPKIVAIPVGSLERLRQPDDAIGRKPFSLITASRLAAEKHIDWLVSAVILAKEEVPELTFDIYGSGSQQAKLQAMIEEAQAQDYIRLMGHCDLTDIYQKYSAYLTASTSEGFGLTLMEAVGSGLPLIGFDVRYGNQTFIEHTKNGYLMERQIPDDEQKIARTFAKYIVNLFKKNSLDKYHRRSYQIASEFLTERIEDKWKKLVKEVLSND